MDRTLKTPTSLIRIAIAGDLHGCWGQDDHKLLNDLNPDCILFVGDLSDFGDVKLVKSIKNLETPTAVILGNHDRGLDRAGILLQSQVNLLGELHCGWRYRDWERPSIGVVGARPCSSGGSYYLNPAVQSVFGSSTLIESAEKITLAAKKVPKDWPLIILAHSGPSGLGSTASSPCGRDWKTPSVDWGDQDLAIAIHNIRKDRTPDLVVFGHTHHSLLKGNGLRTTFVKDQWGTAYLNAACVPRRALDSSGKMISHFSWVEFIDSKLSSVSHRWFNDDSSIAYLEELMNEDSL